MTEEQIMTPTLMSRSAIIGVRNIYDYPDALLEMNECSSEDYDNICYLYNLKKDLPTNQDLTYRDSLVDYTSSDDVTISHFFIIIISRVQWYTLWGE